MQKTLKTLLKQLAGQISDYTTCKTDIDSFNVFTVLGIANKEVILCRFLGELLDPNGSHQMGTFPLSCFASQVLNCDSLTEDEAQQAYVVLEERIDDDRRVDIAIHLKNTVWPIEVKVWAGDQDAQLSDYYQYYKKRYQLDSIFYLTPTGRPPSQKSQGALSSDKIVYLSFAEHIKEWLKHLLPLCKNKDVYVSIKQFIEVIEKMSTDNKQLEMLRNTLKLTNDSKMENIQEINAVLALLEYKEELQREIWKRFLHANLKCGDGFDLADCEESDLKVDKHTLLRVNYKGNTVAWICVQDNLYLYCREIKQEAKQNWHGAADDGYQWIHLSPSGRKKYPMRNCSLKNEDIKIEDVLKDIAGV